MKDWHFSICKQHAKLNEHNPMKLLYQVHKFKNIMKINNYPTNIFKTIKLIYIINNVLKNKLNNSIYQKKIYSS